MTNAETPAAETETLDKLRARATELEQQVRTLADQARTNLVLSELKAEAVRAGMVDLDGLKLLDASTVMRGNPPDVSCFGQDAWLDGVQVARAVANPLLGPDGLATEAYLTGASAIPTAEDLTDIAAMVWPWTEQDSTAPYSQKALYTGTVEQLAARTRGMLGRTAAQLPLLMWNAIPLPGRPAGTWRATSAKPGRSIFPSRPRAMACLSVAAPHDRARNGECYERQ
jgi:hypothetical protein